jgi:5'-nucleotidase
VLISLLLLACKPPTAPEPRGDKVLHIAALNDFHGALYETKARKQEGRAYGGLPWLHAAIKALRDDHPDLVVLDGGDIFQGSWPVNASNGMGSIEAYNLLDIDVAVVGNHEFDYGGIEGGHPLRGALEHAATKANFTWLSANVKHEDGRHWTPEGIAPWTVIERSGVRIGVIGLTTTDTPQTTLTKNVADLRFHDVVETVRNTLPLLEEANVDVVAAVGHLTGSCKTSGYAEAPGSDCVPDGEIGRLLSELPVGTLDLLVAGHAHTTFANRFGDTFVMENRSKGHMIGRLDLVVGPEGVDADASVIHPPWFLIHDAVDPGCEDTPFPTDSIDVGGRLLAPSAEAIALISRLEQSAGSLCDEVGCAAKSLTRDRQRESDVGNVVADAMLAVFPDADIAIQNSGGLRSDVPEGTLRREHLHAVMPFENRLLLVELTAKQLDRLFAIGSSGAHGILQVAGATYRFDAESKEGTDIDGDGVVAEWEQRRLCELLVDGHPLDDARTYKVVTTDFLFEGGDHLGPAFDGTTILSQGPLLRAAINEYVSAHEGCLGEHGPVVAPQAPRIATDGCSTR